MERLRAKSMGRYAAFFHRVDAFCAKMNKGLAAFAVVLFVLVAAQGTARFMEILNNTPSYFFSVDDLNAPSPGGR